MDHRLEHLGRGDREFPSAHGGLDDRLLGDRQLGQLEFDPQVTPGDHDAVRGLEQLVEVLERRGALDLRDDAQARGKPADGLDLARMADEADPEEVDAALNGKGDQVPILLRRQLVLDVRVGQVDPLAVTDRARPTDAALNDLAVDLGRPEHDLSVGQKDPVARRHGEVQVRHADQDLTRQRRARARPQAHDLALDQDDRASLEGAGAHLRTRQVGQNADRGHSLGGGLADLRETSEVVLLRPVGEVEARDRQPLVDQSSDAVLGLRSDRRDDLRVGAPGATAGGGLGASERHARRRISAGRTR